MDLQLQVVQARCLIFDITLERGGFFSMASRSVWHIWNGIGNMDVWSPKLQANGILERKRVFVIIRRMVGFNARVLHLVGLEGHNEVDGGDSEVGY